MSLEQRLETLERTHATGGACEVNRGEMWKAITSLRERLARLETKLLIFGSAIGICGPLAAQLILEWLRKK